MDTIKQATGMTILIICLVILALIVIAKLFYIRKPSFIIDNIAEICILTVVSMLMGVLLIIS